MGESLSMEQLTYIESRLANEKKSVGVAYLLWFFLGGLGGHNFYLGRVGIAIVQLLLFVFGWATSWLGVGFLLLAVWGIWLLVDAFQIPGVVRNHLQVKRTEMMAQMTATPRA